MFQESEKGLKDDSDILFMKNDNFPSETPCPAQKQLITHTCLMIGKNTSKNILPGYKINKFRSHLSKKPIKSLFTMSFYLFTVEVEKRAFGQETSRVRCGKSNLQNQAPSLRGILQHPPCHFHPFRILI